MRSLQGFLHDIGGQLRKTSGILGKFIGQLMIWINRQPNILTLGQLDIAPSDIVLEIGCGPGDGLRLLSQYLRDGYAIGLDHSILMLHAAQALNKKRALDGNISFIHSGIERIPLRSSSVDKIVAINVAYFFSCDGAEIREARRLLKLHGKIALYVTKKETMKNWPFVTPNSHNLMDTEELYRQLLSGGFAGEEITLNNIELPFGIKGIVAIAHKTTADTSTDALIDVRATG